MDRATSFCTSQLDINEAIFAADDHGLEGCLCLNRAAEARTPGARSAYLAKAADHFAKALSLINPATAQPIGEAA